MIGRIFSPEKCPQCGSNLRDNGFNAVACPIHPDHHAKRLRVYFKSTQKRFTNYDRAAKFLFKLRSEVDQGTYDPNDYKREQPNGFSNLVDKFLTVKSHTMKPRSWRNYQTMLDFAVDMWGNRNVKTIKKGDIREVLLNVYDQGKRSTKYVHNVRSALKTFFNWVVNDVELLEYPPRFPEWKYSMAHRKIVTKETQHQILAQIHQDTFADNPRIFIAIELLRTYLELRPMALMGCNEGDFNPDMGSLRIPDTKEGNELYIKLHPADVDLLKGLENGNPDRPLFRYDKGTGGRQPGTRFGHHVLLNTWKRACAKLGVKGVDLYGGTRHSSAVALGKNHSPEKVKTITGHHTSKAFVRYFWLEDDTKAALYAEMKGGAKL